MNVKSYDDISVEYDDKNVTYDGLFGNVTPPTNPTEEISHNNVVTDKVYKDEVNKLRNTNDNQEIIDKILNT